MAEVVEISSDSSSDTILTPIADEQIKSLCLENAFEAFNEIDTILKKYNRSSSNNSITSVNDLICEYPTESIGRIDSQLGASTSDDNIMKKYTCTESDLGKDLNSPNKSSRYELDDYDDEFHFPKEKYSKVSVKKSNASSANSSQSTDTASWEAQSDENSQKLRIDPVKNMKKKTKQGDKEAAKMLKMQERERKKEEQQREKAIKQALSNANRNLKPDQAMKFIKVHIDINIMDAEYGPEITAALENVDVVYSVQSQIIPNTITWTRKVQSHLMNDDGKLALADENTETDELVVILNWKELIDLISSDSLITHLQSIKSVFPNKKMSLAAYGLQRYYYYQKNCKKKDFRNQLADMPQAKVKDTNLFKDVPKIPKQKIDAIMTELQILYSLAFRRLETKQDVSLFVAQYTKAVAQLPYKLEKQNTHMQANWYMSGDNKDCVKVDKDGNGLNRLWHQQLTTFPLARLETAEAVASKYPTPALLMQAYEECENEEAQVLLQDIPIRRAAGPLTSVRKIGPELSKKIHKFFTSLDGDVLL